MNAVAGGEAPRHKLAEDWVLWYDYQDRKYVNTENWSESLQVLSKVKDVGTFWAVYEEVGDVQDLPTSSNMHFFRDGIQPMWEDKRNQNGGKWVLEMSQGSAVQSIWMNTLMFCISETTSLKKVKLDQGEVPLLKNICGAVFSPRKSCVRISIWTNVKDKRALCLGNLWKEFAGISSAQKITFRPHENSIKGTRDAFEDETFTL